LISQSSTAQPWRAPTIRISSNDPNAPTVDLTANGFGAQPAITTIIATAGNFGNVCVGSQSELNLTIANPSACPLTVSGISSSDSADFQVAAVTSFSLLVCFDQLSRLHDRRQSLPGADQRRRQPAVDDRVHANLRWPEVLHADDHHR
jgi:hypothetical protein